MAVILDGIRVLDFGRYVAAPFCCQLLADMGAEVIRVERAGGEPDRQRGPIGPNGQSLYFVALNRNKRAVTLNLDTDGGRTLLLDLVKLSDVLVHNQPAPRAEALGLDYPSLRGANPRLVHLAVTGFGPTGPYSSYTAFDPIIQAITGLASMAGFDGQPTLSPLPIEDFTTGLYGALAITLALYHRERTGLGQSVDVSLLSTGLSLIGSFGVFAEAAINRVVRRSVGNDLYGGVGGCYHATDGQVVVSSLGEALWRKLCHTIEHTDLLEDSRLSNDQARYEHRDVVNAAITSWTSHRTVEEVVEILAEAGIPVGAVESVDRVAAHRQAHAQEMIHTVSQPGLGDVPVSGTAMKFSDTPSVINLPSPAVGEHNQEVYDGLFGAGASQRLTRGGAI
jgi:CoA:oxalate CoA-transferase